MDLNQSSALLAAFVNLAVCIAILLRDRQRRLFVRFAILALNLCVWHTASFIFRAFASPASLQLRFAAGALVPVSILSVFTSLISVRSKVVEPLKRTVLVASLLIASLSLTPWFEKPWADAAAATVAAVSIFATFQLVWYRSRSAQQRTDKLRLRTLVIGGAATSLLSVGDSFGSGPFPTIAHISIAIYMYFLYQTIITYRLIDLAELIAKGSVVIALTVILGALFELLLFWVGTGRGQFFFNSFIASFVILILYDQIRPWIEVRTIRLMFRERDAFNQTVVELLPRLRATIDLREVIDTALDALYNSRRLTHAAVYLIRDQELGFTLVSYRGPKPPPAIDPESNGAFFGEALRQKVPLLKENFEHKLNVDPEAAEPVSEAERARAGEVLTTFNELGTQVVLPLISNGEAIGLLCLGDARVQSGFPADEIALAYQVADQIAVSAENSAEFERVRERDRLAALGEMSAGLAHEIRNPLGAIQGAAQVLQPNQFPEETRELLSVIVEEVARLNNVVSQFLEYARPNKSALQPTDLNHVVQRTLTLFAEEEKSAAVVITTSLAPGLPSVMSDAEHLRQVLFNLLLNAVEAFDGAAGRIEVSTRTFQLSRGAKSVVELRVRDNGPGIDQDNLRRIFVPFFTTKAKGTGLGLAICQRIITAQGGRMEVQSRPNAGTTFVVRLPGRSEEAGRAEGARA